MSQNVRAGTNKSSGFIIKFAAYSFAIFSPLRLSVHYTHFS